MSLCHCGCGQPTPLAKVTNTRGGYRKGEPTRFLPNHHQRTRRKRTPEEALTRYLQSGDPSECWPWRGTRQRQGYGVVGVGGRQEKAHRLVYELFKGPIPNDLIVRHTCDNPPCVNPNHLLTGTHGDNARDKAERGRSTFGERARTARLTERDVSLIRARATTGEHSQALAEEFGVSKSAVRHIIAGRTWRHVA